MAGRKHKVSLAECLAAIGNSYGVVKIVCSRLKIAWGTFNSMRQRYRQIQDAMHAEEESLKDLVEVKLIEKIKQGNLTALIYWSKCKMKDRGYVERTELTGADGQPIATTLSDRLRQVVEDEKRERAQVLRMVRAAQKAQALVAAPKEETDES